MAYRGKARLVDGFTTLRATQRHGVERKYSTRSEADESAPKKDKGAPDKARPAKGSMSIGRTVMPTQNEIVCYSCGFGFIMRGRADSTQCPKCGARLGLKDETVTGACSEEIITAGKVRLTKSAVLDGGKVIANDITLEGTVKSGSLRAYKTLELGAGAVIPEEMIEAKNLRIAVDASFDFRGDMTFHDVEVFGELKANIRATGMVTVHPGGHLLGKLETQHLVVEEGAGLNADVIVEPEPEENENGEEEEMRKTA
jgi:cytoskeletal protein CcmA (bactofilin family)